MREKMRLILVVPIAVILTSFDTVVETLEIIWKGEKFWERAVLVACYALIFSAIVTGFGRYVFLAYLAFFINSVVSNVWDIIFDQNNYDDDDEYDDDEEYDDAE